jgi:predicted lipase
LREADEPRAGVEGKTMKFDYDMPAELFMAKRKGKTYQRLGYRRFATAAEAIRFAIEEFPAVQTLGAYMQVGEERFASDAIERLYESSDYPLPRAR